LTSFSLLTILSAEPPSLCTSTAKHNYWLTSQGEYEQFLSLVGLLWQTDFTVLLHF